MKPSPIVVMIFAELQDDAQQAPRWFWPVMLCLAVWAAGGLAQAGGEHAALQAGAALMASQEPHGK